MARKESPDRPLFARVQAQLQVIGVEAMLHAAQEDLLHFIRKAPLVYGFWADFKRLVKAAEGSVPVGPTAALLARLDTAALPKHTLSLPVSPLEGQINQVGRLDYDGKYAYLISVYWNSPGLYIVDMTIPAMPTVVTHIKLPGLSDVVVAGTKMFLLQGTAENAPGKLYCYDVSDPGHPQKESEILISNGIRLAVAGSTICVATMQPRSPGLQLVDASRRDQLRLLGRLHVKDPIAVQIAGSHVYVISTPPQGNLRTSLVIADISDPLQPRQIHTLDLPPATGLVIQGRYAYVACTHGSNTGPDDQTGLAVIDLAPPNFTAAQRVAFVAVGNVQDVAVEGRYVYVGVGKRGYSDRNNGGLRIFDISDPARPQLAGSFMADEAHSMKVVGDIACLTVAHRWNELFLPMNVAEPARPLLLGAPPSRDTLGYMKRRGRRLMRTLALQDPEVYVRTAAQMLIEAGQAQTNLDPRLQWISMDLLYGGGTRFEQQAHGRGSYSVARRGLSLRTREERHPELWDRYPELAQQLFTTPRLPWQTWEASCKMLRNITAPLPVLNDGMLAQFLASESPLLRSVAARQVAAMLEAGRNVAADVVAETYVGGTRRQRETIARFIAAQESTSRWMTAFATRLYKIANGLVRGAVPRKAALSFALLIAHFPDLSGQDVPAGTAVALYGTGRPIFEAWARSVFGKLLPLQLPEWLFALAALPAGLRESAAQAVAAGMATQAIPPRTLWSLTSHEDPWVREVSWRILARSQTPLPDIAIIWTALLAANEATPALLTAFAAPDALALFDRCEFDSWAMAGQLEANPFLIPLLPPAALEKIVSVLPPASLLQVVAEASDEQWPRLRQAILLGSLLPKHRTAFWREVFAAIGATGNANLTLRLLDDVPMQAAFLQLADISEFLRSANPLFGLLLGLWIAGHTDLFRRDSAELLQIATHPLPQIRVVGLARAREVGLSLPFALRLLEARPKSRLPNQRNCWVVW